MTHHLKIALTVLTGAAFLAEMLASPVARCLTLLISAYHMLYKLLLFICEQLSQRKCGHSTYGRSRQTDLGRLLISTFTGCLCLAAGCQLFKVALHAPHGDKGPGHPALVVGLGVLDVGLSVACLPFDGGLGNGGWRRTFDVLLDVSPGLLVIVCGYSILLSGASALVLSYVDAIFALIALAALIITVYPLMKKCALIVLQNIPDHIDIEDLTKKLKREFPSVLDIHDFHVWSLSSAEAVATLHVLVSSRDADGGTVEALNRFLMKQGIQRVTVQLEVTTTPDPGSTKLQCLLKCRPRAVRTCRGPLIRWQVPHIIRVPDIIVSDTNGRVIYSSAPSDDSPFSETVAGSIKLGPLTQKDTGPHHGPGESAPAEEVATSDLDSSRVRFRWMFRLTNDAAPGWTRYLENPSSTEDAVSSITSNDDNLSARTPAADSAILDP